MDAINSFLGGKIGAYVSIAVGFIAGYFHFTPDATVAPTVSNFLLSCLIGGAGLVYAHFAHNAATGNSESAPK